MRPVRESLLGLKRRARRINRALAEQYPYAHAELDFRNPFELLVATVLSAQTTDVTVNQITPLLFARYPDARSMAEADPAELEAIIKPTGFFRAKTRNLMALCNRLVDEYDGEVPGRLDDLVTLPGVGRKTANVVLGNAFGIPGITVDTHFGRLARRFGWTDSDDPVKVESDVGRTVRAEGLDHALAPGGIPRPARLPFPQAGLRGLRGGELVPQLRHGRDGPGEGEEAAEVRACPGSGGAAVEAPRRDAPGRGNPDGIAEEAAMTARQDLVDLVAAVEAGTAPSPDPRWRELAVEPGDRVRRAAVLMLFGSLDDVPAASVKAACPGRPGCPASAARADAG